MIPWAETAANNLDVAIEHFVKFDTDQNGAIDINELKQADAIGLPAYMFGNWNLEKWISTEMAR